MIICAFASHKKNYLGLLLEQLLRNKVKKKTVSMGINISCDHVKVDATFFPVIGILKTTNLLNFKI